MNDFPDETPEEETPEEEVEGEGKKYDGGEIPRTEAVPEE